MTIVEVVFAMGILAMALVAVLLLVVKAHEANTLNRARMVALDEARSVQDELRAAKLGGVALPKELLSQFPPGERKLSHPLLNDGMLELSYDNAGSDPLYINVSVRWTDLRGRPANVALSSALSRY